MFGSDGSPIIQYVVIFAVIFTALAAIVFVVRRLTGRGLALPGRGNGRGRQPRLGIVDVYELDRARQLILLRRDNVEHLLLVGGPNDVVVERNIQRGQRPLPEASLIPEPLRTETTDALPDPLAGTGRLAEPQRPLADHRRPEPAFDPGFEMPVVVAPPVPRSGAVPPVTLPLDASLIGGDEPGQDLPAVVLSAPARTPVPAAQPAREPFSARRILRRTAPPLLDPRPEPASERLPGAPPATPEAAPVPPEALPEPPTATSPPPPMLAVPGERRPVDPGVLSDMARQLQAALARPASAVTPAPPPAVEARVDPVAAAMAAPAPPEPLPEPVSPEPAPEPTPQVPPAPKAVAPALEPAAPPAVRPSLREKSPAPAPAAAEAAPPAPTANPAGNPFSVEEIEAEFARLLGRPLGKRG